MKIKASFMNFIVCVSFYTLDAMGIEISDNGQ